MKQKTLFELPEVHRQVAPALFASDRWGTWFFVEATEDNVGRLLCLSRDHVFNVASDGEAIVVMQGEAPYKFSHRFLPPNFRGKKPLVVVDVGRSESVCGQCRDVSRCRGLLACLPPIVTGPAVQARGVEALGEAMAISCWFLREGRADKKTLEPADLKALNLTPLTSTRAFTDDVGAGEGDIVRRLQGVDLRSDEAIAEIVGSSWLQDVLGDGFRVRNYRPEPSRYYDLMFDEETIAANRLRASIRAYRSGAERSKHATYRRENCKTCLYKCDRTPWRLDNPRPMTMDRLMDEWRPDAERRRWLTLFTITGEKGGFINPDTGRRKVGIGTRVDDDHRIVITSLIPSYPVIAYRSPEDYWQETDASARRKFELEEPELDERGWAHLNLALTGIVNQGDDVRFRNGGAGWRNDVLAIELYPNGRHIRIHSDSRATQYGGMFTRGGDSIPSEGRPRFHTDYDYPFLHDIFSWFGSAPFACAGRTRNG